jgi:RPA family protein
VSEAITTAEEFVYRRQEVGMLLDALDESVEFVKEVIREYWVAEDGRRQLQRQRDAAVALLRNEMERSYLDDVTVESREVAIELALAALGAEETK